jgi:hypothetical protein
MVKEPVDDKNLVLMGRLHLLGSAVFALGALVMNGDDRSLFEALAFFSLMFGGAYEYLGRRGQVWRAIRRRASSRRNRA